MKKKVIEVKESCFALKQIYAQVYKKTNSTKYGKKLDSMAKVQL